MEEGGDLLNEMLECFIIWFHNLVKSNLYLSH